MTGMKITGLLEYKAYTRTYKSENYIQIILEYIAFTRIFLEIICTYTIHCMENGKVGQDQLYCHCSIWNCAKTSFLIHQRNLCSSDISVYILFIEITRLASLKRDTACRYESVSCLVESVSCVIESVSCVILVV